MDMDAKEIFKLSKAKNGVPVKIKFVPTPINDLLIERRELLQRAGKGVVSKDMLILEMCAIAAEQFASETAQIKDAVQALENAGV